MPANFGAFEHSFAARNRHLIADRLGWLRGLFSGAAKTLVHSG